MLVAQLAAHLKLPFALSTVNKQMTDRDAKREPPKLAPSLRAAAARAAGDDTAMAPVVPNIAATAGEQREEPTSGSTATGVSSAIEERMRLMAQRRKAKARSFSIGAAS